MLTHKACREGQNIITYENIFWQWLSPRNGNNINLLESVLSLNADDDESAEDDDDLRRL
jgi:hypothetical protein